MAELNDPNAFKQVQPAQDASPVNPAPDLPVRRPMPPRNRPPSKKRPPRVRKPMKEIVISNFGRFGDIYLVFMNKVQNLTATNFDLACYYAETGRYTDAILRFRITLWLSPNHVESLYQLGCCYMNIGERTKAIRCFAQVLKMKPQHEFAIFMMSLVEPKAIRPEARPRTMPYAMAVMYFNRAAPIYTASQREARYRGHDLMHQLLGDDIATLPSKQMMVDIGCGSGLVGSKFPKLFTQLVGVDLSQGMLEEANRVTDDRGVKVYTKLVHRDCRAWLAEAPAGSIDLITACNMLQYVGDLVAFMEGAAQSLRQQGMLAITFEPLADNDQDFALNTERGRFAHSRHYVAQLARQCGLEEIRSGEVMIYPKVAAELCIYRKL